MVADLGPLELVAKLAVLVAQGRQDLALSAAHLPEVAGFAVRVHLVFGQTTFSPDCWAELSESIAYSGALLHRKAHD